MLLAEEDWNAINETLYLLSVPGMRESIIDGLQKTLMTVPVNWIGNVVAAFYKASAEGRAQAGFIRS